MDDHKHKIVVRGIKAHRTFLRSIQCQVEKWIKRELGSDELSRGCVEYHVELERDDESAFFYCSVSILSGFQQFRSTSVGKTFQESLALALRHLYASYRISRLNKGQVLKLHPVSA